MVLHPDAQSRAQREIDNVVGTGRLPNFGDEMSLPYVSALVEEVMRWHPVAPVGAHYPAFFPIVKQLTVCVVFDLQRFLTA
jgi:cytochrome P450